MPNWSNLSRDKNSENSVCNWYVVGLTALSVERTRNGDFRMFKRWRFYNPMHKSGDRKTPQQSNQWSGTQYPRSRKRVASTVAFCWLRNLRPGRNLPTNCKIGRGGECFVDMWCYNRGNLGMATLSTWPWSDWKQGGKIVSYPKRPILWILWHHIFSRSQRTGPEAIQIVGIQLVRQR